MKATATFSNQGDEIVAPAGQRDLSAVVPLVREHGYALVPGFFELAFLNDLSREFVQIQTDKPVGFGAYPRSDHLRIMTLIKPDTIREKVIEHNFTALQKLLYEFGLEGLVAAFYAEDYLYPHSVYFVHSMATNTTMTQLPYVQHFDKLRKLKFFVFLDDVEVCHGPTWVVPGSQIANCRKRAEWQTKEFSGKKTSPCVGTDKHHEAIDNLTSFDPQSEVPLTATKGTLVILDTDTSHRAGELSPGCQRRVIRIDSASPAYAGVASDVI